MLEDIKDFIDYNPSTGKFTSKVDYYSWKIGEEVGAAVDGYIYICFRGKSHPAHRLAFWFMTGEYYTGDIDHKNRNRKDNRWENIRKCSRAENMMNTLPHKDSSTGVKGVYFRKDTGKYSVRVTIDGRYKSLGCFRSLEEAAQVADEARTVHHGAYHNNNNKDA